MEVAAIFLPLVGFLIAGLFGRFIGDRGAMAVTVSGVCIAALLSIWLFVDIALGANARTVHLFTWIDSGAF
ncbi:MAG TPA: NADH-quinone oxidoreductase subunit L, partial [Alphaproteobacteria bacterium]|nr:NADH-quinone oxidoreductase subunit L [Alphaproteobacteria bacterium]